MTTTSRQRRLIAAFAIVAMLLAACGASDETSDSRLQAFAEVQATDFVFEADAADPGRGIFRVRTTEPMICAIVWGETTDFGNFNNSLSMNGTGIVDHDVALPGASAGTTYFFRVQGTTADGSQYRSEIGTFVIPESDVGSSSAPAVEVGENLALGASVVAASSVFGSGWEPVNAIDGDNSTEWATSGDGNAASITIDLGEPEALAAVEFVTRSMLDGSAVTETFTVTIDGGDTLGPFPAGNPANRRPAVIDATGRQITFDVESSTGGNVGAVEIGIYGPVGG